MTSVKGPQLQVNDLVLVKIVAHKARHKIQDRWESEEYIVIEQLFLVHQYTVDYWYQS